MSAHLIKGFADPITSAQKVFRRSLKAMSEPGIEVALTDEVTLPGLNPSTTALLLTLLDQDTPLWLPTALRTPELIKNLAFHCGCPLVDDQAEAQFAVYDLADFLAAEKLTFSLGNDRYPDQSATVLIQLPEAAATTNSVWRGPGIETQRHCALPLNAEFWARRQRLIAFPCGVDYFLASKHSVMGLPRTTQITQQEETVCM